MPVRVYRSTDASAPVLTGQAGSLCTLLDAVLVNGYGAVPAAGWTIAYTGTSKRAYRMSTAAGNTGMYLNVDDAGGGTGGAREAFMTGYQAMTALATGTGQFPTSAQLNLGTAPAGAVVARKSNTLDATARVWTIVADDTCFYLFVEEGTSNQVASTFMFGDIFSYGGAGDIYKCMIMGKNTATTTITVNSDTMQFLCQNLTQVNIGHFMAASPNGVGGSITVGKHSDSLKSAMTGSFQTNPAYGFGTVSASIPMPNPVDGGIHFAPVWVHHGNNTLRGYLKGLWCPMQFRPTNHHDVFVGTGAQAGKTFLTQSVYWNNSSLDFANVIIEISDTWS